MWWLASWPANLRNSERSLIPFLLTVVAVVGGLLAGVLIGRRVGNDRPMGFGSTVGALVGFICGALYSICMEIGFVSSYGGSPVNFVDGAAIVLSLPVFALLAGMVGAAMGAVMGAVAAFLTERLSAGPA